MTDMTEKARYSREPIMKYLALAAALSVAMPVMGDWRSQDQIDALEDRIEELEECHSPRQSEQSRQVMARVWQGLYQPAQPAPEMQKLLAENLELERRNAILQEQLDLMAAKYRPQEQTAPFDYLGAYEEQTAPAIDFFNRK